MIFEAEILCLTAFCHQMCIIQQLRVSLEHSVVICKTEPRNVHYHLVHNIEMFAIVYKNIKQNPVRAIPQVSCYQLKLQDRIEGLLPSMACII